MSEEPIDVDSKLWRNACRAHNERVLSEAVADAEQMNEGDPYMLGCGACGALFEVKDWKGCLDDPPRTIDKCPIANYASLLT